MDRARLWFQGGFAAGAEGWTFTRPDRVIVAREAHEIGDALGALRAASEAGLWAAGFIGYEAAPGIDPALAVREPAGSLPLLWFGIFQGPQCSERDPVAAPRPAQWTAAIERAAYLDRVARIRELIAAGDVYQVNFTYPMLAAAPSEPYAFWRGLADAGHGEYGAYIDIGSHVIASLSPELFFRQEGDMVETRPMKGTSARGRWEAEDRARAAALLESPKERAENLMIVDLLRNDLGRVATAGTVDVTNLFAVEKYPTVWQLTSTIAARTAAHPVETLAALFPCGSVTGAPKIRAMQLIAELETKPRGIYTGAIGWIGPGRRACFSVAIRTVEIERESGSAVYGVGGGITWDSDPKAEWEETRRKAAALAPARDGFDLFETMLWTPRGGYALLERHLKRMRASAEFFGFPFEIEAAHRVLDVKWAEARRVRLALRRDGRFSLDSKPFDPQSGKIWRVAVAAEPVDPEEPRLCHKTSWREPYERARAGRPGFDDVLLFNARGELTESTIANVAVERDGRLLTPARECGLLAGTLREEMLGEGRLEEAVIPAASLRAGEPLWLLNSVRGWVRAVLARTDRD